MDKTNPLIETDADESMESQLQTLVEVQDSSSDYVFKEEEDVIKIPKAVLLNLIKQIEDLNEEVESLEDEISSIQSNMSQFDERSDQNSMRMDSMYSYFESELRELQTDYEQRLTQLENQLSEPSEKTQQTPKSKIERLVENNDISDLQINTQRAVTVYQNFNQWSESIPAGRRIKSGHLQTALSEEFEDVNWMKQVHRVMNRFDELTDDQFVLRETNQFGTEIIKRED
jgi:predicted RNase H-like nuclease (RuvC/YqgF family)